MKHGTDLFKKPAHIKLKYNVGDVVVMKEGNRAVITYFGIYDGQYWVEKCDGMGTCDLCWADYEYTDEGGKPYGGKTILGLETDEKNRLSTLKAVMDALDEWSKRYPGLKSDERFAVTDILRERINGGSK